MKNILFIMMIVILFIELMKMDIKIVYFPKAVVSIKVS